MVEMSETAEILRHATSKSLILLDEIGRGTSTFDGLSIAWALVEHIAKNIRAITLFSTHYHELIELADSLLGVQNFTVKTIQQKGKVKFLYELIEEGATQSFGIYVAELAGIPKEVLERAQTILKDLEQKSQSEDLPIFQIPINLESEIENEMRLANLNELTPIEALNLLVKWQNRLKVKKAEDFPTAFPENLLHK